MASLVSVPRETLVVLFLVGGGAAEVTACDLGRAVGRYWNDLRAGDLVETETRTESKGHRSRSIATAEVVAGTNTHGFGQLVLKLSERFDGEADASGGKPAQKVRIASGSTFVMTATGDLIHTRWTFDGDKPTKPREEKLAPAQAANRLPGLPAYCVEEPAKATEPVDTAAGTFSCKQYEVEGSKLWISPEVPLGGLVRSTAAGPDETLDSKVTRVKKGKR